MDETRPVIGWYQPHDRSTDYTGEIVNPFTGEVSTPPSMTKQSFARECDINNIIKDFKVTGQIAHINEQARQGAYIDLPDALDYQQSLEAVRHAQVAFATLPAKVRDELGNDPERFLAFISNPANQDRLIEWGLATDTRPPPPAPPATPAPTPAPSPPSSNP